MYMAQLLSVFAINDYMKAITIMQPWAKLIVLGVKAIETKTWSTTYRGRMLIHANSTNRYAIQLSGNSLVKNQVGHWNGLYYGHIIGSVHLDNILEIDMKQYLAEKKSGHLFASLPPDPAMEMVPVNYTGQLYTWLLSNPQEFKNPVVAKGKIKLWDFDFNE